MRREAIQEYLTAAIQNIEVLIRYGKHPRRRMAGKLTKLWKVAGTMAIGLRDGFLLCCDFFASGYIAAISTRAR